MSADIYLVGLPRAILAADVAASLVMWCGTEIAELRADPVLHVALRGQSSPQMEDEWRIGPRVIEVWRSERGPAKLITRMADAYTWGIARAFAVHYVRRITRGRGHARSAQTGEVFA